jgi:protein SCO1/2
MRHAALTFWLMLILVGSVAYGSWLAWRQFGDSKLSTGESEAATGQFAASMRGNLPPGVPLPDFELTDQRGHKFHSSSLRGQVWVASYFFASCPGPCFRLNQALASLQTEPALDAVKFVSITCDPANDPPETLRTYSERFNANPKRWVFLTGELEPILAYGQQRFLVPIAQGTHSELAIVMDRQSTVRGYFHLTDANDVNHMRVRLQQLLDEPAPAPESKTAADKPGDSATPSASMTRAAKNGSANAAPVEKDRPSPANK